MDFDLVADFQFVKVLVLFAQLDRHLALLGAFDRHDTLGGIDCQDCGRDIVFDCPAADQHVIGEGRKTGSRHQRSKGNGLGQGTKWFHRLTFRIGLSRNEACSTWWRRA
ncbi:hypothetical protein D3C71_1931290 [compost metagenome]